jgi:hypothetical protein
MAISLLLAAGLLVAACGAAAPPIPDVQIQAADYSFAAPDSIPGGLTRLRLSNTGNEIHHAQLLRLNDGVTPAQFQAALQKGMDQAFPLVTFQGGPSVAAPGQTSSAIVDLPPGQYLILDVIPGPDGAPHVTKGMARPLAVTAKPAPQPAPPEALAVQLLDFAFGGNKGSYTRGAVTFEATNLGKQYHELVVIKVQNGATTDQARDALVALASGAAPAGPPPAAFLGGLQGIMPGLKGYAEFDLQPGSYAFICLLPDPASGKPHAALGMFAPFTVQ